MALSKLLIALLFVAGAELHLAGHAGPPYPILSNQRIGPYDVSIWSDPDATSDGSAGGKFWIVLATVEAVTPIPASTRASVTVQSADRPTAPVTVVAQPVDGDASRQYAALVLDHEGRFRVVTRVAGPLGSADAEAFVDATDDLRPPPYLVGVYLFPFVAVGAIWIKVLLRKRTAQRRTRDAHRERG